MVLLDKESYAVMETLAQFHWIVITRSGFNFHNNHNNLIFLFGPLSFVQELSQTSLRKVLPWSVRMKV